MENLVILDIGSNSVRMAINQIQSDGSYREIKRIKSDSRLSEGMGNNKILQPEAMKRTIDALVGFHKIYENYKSIKVIGIATAAVRQAKNQSEFLDQIKQKIGIEIRVLTGNQEAYYDYVGVMNRLGLKNCVILDIGGASCEIVRVEKGKPIHLDSVPIGAVNITEKYRLTDRISGANLFNAQINLKKTIASIRWINKIHHQPLVLLGGASRSLARINRKRQHMNRIDAIHGYHLTVEQVNRTFTSLLKGNLRQRKQVPGLEPDRADIIVGGLLPLMTIIDITDARKMYFSESGVREGIIVEYIKKYHLDSNSNKKK
ncbi:Ppx/GppA family phosphatase [Lentilactobacillus laojiaonis]|uniref:Ppx/GppA family phosphatase n=1 Tax=Lentilactobacillus laojiaonis TaxID=2883998 RepID=UPI001D0B4E70|nr:Ppx/GppA family phosphatase [Lentilactobacillus laojiaonis]UDM31950.1 Ppx/GppA family phosphatase [Lentilactobacillus laojiaonis]